MGGDSSSSWYRNPVKIALRWFTVNRVYRVYRLRLQDSHPVGEVEEHHNFWVVGPLWTDARRLRRFGSMILSLRPIMETKSRLAARWHSMSRQMYSGGTYVLLPTPALMLHHRWTQYGLKPIPTAPLLDDHWLRTSSKQLLLCLVFLLLTPLESLSRCTFLCDRSWNLGDCWGTCSRPRYFRKILGVDCRNEIHQ